MIEYDRGIHLLGTDLRFDSVKKAKFSFISSANVGRFSPPEKVIATPETIKLLDKRIKKSVTLACPYKRPFTIGNVQVELIPSGYIPGASQIIVNTESDTIVYTGDINLRESLTAPPARIKRCPIVILKCTYSAPKYAFPPAEEVIGSMVEFIDDTLASGAAPVILAETLGKAEETVKILSEAGYKLSLHKSVYRSVKMYEELGIKFSGYESFKPKKTEGKVLIFPPHKGESKSINKIKHRRTAILMEHSADEKPHIMKVFKADEAFPLSNHADHDDLLRFVELMKPQKVYLIGGHSGEFARTLQTRGYEAVPLEKPTQLKLL